MRTLEPRVRLEASFESEWPGADRLSTECVLNLWVTGNRLGAVSEEAVRAAGFPSLAAFNVLTVLEGAAEPLPPSVIAERVFVTRGAITGVMRSLETRRLIRVDGDEADRRRRLVRLTPGTARRVRRYLARVHASERRLFDGMPVDERRRFLRSLAWVQGSIEQLTI